MKKKNFIWSDNWWIEDDKAWFIPGDGGCNAIFCIDLNNRICSYIAEMPDGIIKDFRLYSGCMKYKNSIFCMPNVGKHIWIYDLELKKFVMMKIHNPENVSLNILNFWRFEDSIFAVSIGLNQIIEIDVDKKKIVSQYNISENANDKVTTNNEIVDNYIFMVSAHSNCIFQFDMEKKYIEKFELKHIDGKLDSICFDGNNFWLGGYRRELYKWDKEKNSIEIKKIIPYQFGVYKLDEKQKYKLDCESYENNLPLFLYLISTKNSIYFIPFKANKIVYVDKETEKIHIFEIKDEDEREDWILKNKMEAKYILQYVIADRYIGLFSLKNNCIVEIDTIERRIEYISYSFDEETKKILVQKYDKEKAVCYEENAIDQVIFWEKFYNS